MAGQVLTAARRLAGRAALRDASLAAGLLAAVALLGPPHQRAVVLWWIATGVAVIAVGLRNRWPLAMLVVSTVCVAAHVAQGSLIGGSDAAVLILVYTVAARRSPATSLATLAGVLLVLLCWNGYFALRGRSAPGIPSMAFQVNNVEQGAGPAFERTELITGDNTGGAARWSGPAVLGGALVAAWAIGSGSRSRRAYLDQLAARARDLQREQDQRAALAMAAERDRISRELHDVVAHGLSLIVIQAQGGVAALDDQPAETRVALDAIVRTGRASLTDMRRVLDALGEGEDAWHPPPGLAQLPTLVDQVRRAGTEVRLRIDGVAAPLPAPLDLSAYRIVQEALTNVMKHADAGSSADIVLCYRETELDIEIRNGTVGGGADGGGKGGGVVVADGNGLSGMRERVHLLGGRFTAGPRPDGGFQVWANLPIGNRRA
ncbi:histidine kinase [Micromonospora sp. NPDC053740]|uniref:sensor histidine kinase n=1 Tax=Micromonospora TaxID=1873 RepID=UPI001EE99078|nr:histidine kinase [Micromonospora alfalfae]MCG5466848.1 histidine kinase [Micromonospora alfalfae]